MKEHQRWYQLAVELQAIAYTYPPWNEHRAVWNDLAASTRKLGDEAGGNK
jgi:hypothetical protein